MKRSINALHLAHVAGVARPCAFDRGYAWLGSVMPSADFVQVNGNVTTKRTTRRLGRRPT